MVEPRSLLITSLALALSCTTSDPPSAGAGPTPTPAPAPPPATLEPGAAPYDVHEWGLVDYALVARTHEIATGPGLHRWPVNPAIPPTPVVPTDPLGTPSMNGEAI